MPDTARTRHLEELARRARLRLPLFLPGAAPPLGRPRGAGRPSRRLEREGHPHRARWWGKDFQDDAGRC